MISFLISILWTINTWAHPLDLAFVEVKLSPDHIHTVLDLHPDAEKKFSGQSYFGSDCELIKRQEMNSQLVKLSHSCAKDLARLDFHFLQTAAPGYKVLGRIVNGNEEKAFSLDKDNSVLQISDETSFSFLPFIRMGTEHIGALPGEWYSVNEGLHWPEGLDHILFIIALVCGGGGLLQIFKTISGFTIGHSISLILISYKFLSITSAVVEPIIALSIVYVALEVLFLKNNPHRFSLAALFGFIHGMGFASALENLNLKPLQMAQALLSFNVGIELGQVIIILMTVPGLMLMERFPLFHRYALKTAAMMVACLGSFWFYQRTLGI